MIRRRFQLKETIVTIIAEHECEIEAGISAIIHHRRELESYIMKDPFFSVTLEPYEPELDDAPLIVQKMVEASKKVGCGPMSAVAGTIAYLALSAMIEEGADHAIVDNGGDIALTTDRSVIVGIYAGNYIRTCQYAIYRAVFVEGDQFFKIETQALQYRKNRTYI